MTRALALIASVALLVAVLGAASADAKRRHHHHHRPGCGKFCRQAGGFGGGPEPKTMPVEIHRQSARVNRDGVVRIKARCTLDKRCVGAILIASTKTDFEYGRSNLRIGAHKTRTVRVLITRKGRRHLARHGRDSHAFATVPLKSDDPVSIGNHLTLLPHR